MLAPRGLLIQDLAPKGLDRSDREIDIGYRCVTARRGIVLIGQSDFNDTGRSKHRRNDLAGNALVLGAHSHHSDEVHFECKIFHDGASSPHPNTAAAYLIRWSHEPVPRFIYPDIGGQTEGRGGWGAPLAAAPGLPCRGTLS